MFADYPKKNIKVKQLWSPLSTNFSAEASDLMKTPTEEKTPNLSLLDEITSENLKIKKELDLLSLKLESDCKMNMKEICENGQTNQPSFEETQECNENIEAPNESCEKQPDITNSDLNTDYARLDCGEEQKEFRNGCKDQSSDFTTNDFENLELSYLSDTKNWFKSHYLGNENNSESIRNEFHNSQLYKVRLAH